MNASHTDPAPVPFVTIDRQHAGMLPELRAAFERVVGASAFVLGTEVEAFEAEFADYCGVGYCIGVASGTAALTLALRAASIRPGDEVIVPGHTFIASALGILHAGAIPVFADVEDATGLLDARSAAEAVTARTAGILPVHLYGQVCDMDAIRALAEQHGLFVLEDAAQAHGATYRSQRTGSLGDAAAFSFYPSKNLGALGDGGAICTNDAAIAQRARELRHLGQRRKGEHVAIGANERLDGLQAAFLQAKLPHLDGWNEARRSFALEYDRLLGARGRVLAAGPGSRCVYHLYPIRLAERDRVADQLRAARIATGIHYYPAAHRHPAFEDLPQASQPLPLPISEAWAAQQLSLPMGAELTIGELERVGAALGCGLD